MEKTAYQPNHEDPTKSGGWFQVPNRLVTGGWLKLLSAMELKTWLVFACRARGGVAFCGPADVARQTGVTCRSAERAIASLVAKGLLVNVSVGPGRGRVAQRSPVVPKNPAQAVGIRPRENPAQAVGISTRKNPAQRPKKTRRNHALKPGAIEQENPAQGAGGIRLLEQDYEQDSINNTGGCAAAAGGGGAVVVVKVGEEERQDPQEAQRLREAEEALIDLGVNNPTRGQLLRIPGLTASVVETVHDNLSPGARTGVLIANLKGEAPRLIAEEQQRRREEEAWREVQRLEAAKAAEAIAGLSDETAAELWELYGPQVKRRVISRGDSAPER